MAFVIAAKYIMLHLNTREYFEYFAKWSNLSNAAVGFMHLRPRSSAKQTVDMENH